MMAKADKSLDRLKSKMDMFGARKLYYLRERGTRTWLVAISGNLCGTAISGEIQ